MTHINELADRYVAAWAALSPVDATHIGEPGYDDKLDDLSPEGFAARGDLKRDTLAELAALTPGSAAETTATEVMQERLGTELTLLDAGDTAMEVSVLATPLHSMRRVFDVMPAQGEAAMADISARLGAFPRALTQWRHTLLDQAAKGNVSARQQIIELAGQCVAWTDPARDNFFLGLVDRLAVSGTQRAELIRNATAAASATADFGEFLRTELAPRGRPKQAVGPERYARASQYFLGARIDLRETYAWGFAELAQVEAEMRQVAAEIAGPGATVERAVEVLDADPSRILSGPEAFREWMQALAESTIASLNGTHFDIPPAVRTIEARIAPTHEGLIYYTPPNADFSRPGRMWWAVPESQKTFSTWQQTAVVFHEGVPGHHLQLGQAIHEADRLNRWQRQLCFCAGHGEGWALYAERLMEELGYLQDPGDRLGMLDVRALRTIRVIIDIGMHLELEIPRDNPFGFHPGERWTPELGWEFLSGHSRLPTDMLRFELKRYLGMPGQAPAYKVGERLWLRAREQARARSADFDLKRFHTDALNLGSVGLDALLSTFSRL
ncbi:DUF885 domain-containing protein [Actinoplanes sp. NPDC049596]|uniref:DUF885 domain-containing protein n=1 Tax=unclassified Actinoplanes TaxID=2626549 RepID=UPI0034331F9E